MKPSSRIPVAGVVLLLCVVVAGGVRLHDVSAQEPRSAEAASMDVILIRCKTAGNRFRVTSYQGSNNTPAQRTDSCAENVSLLSREGFVVRDIGHYDDQDVGFAVISLVRQLPRP
jgi:hypothetical protein